MPSDATHMRREILEIPGAVDRLLCECAPAIKATAAAIARLDPPYFSTVARGSSDHAATYFKYVTELMTGLPVASIGPSVASIYGTRLRLAGSVCLSISQSGKSPDIVELARSAGESGALTLAVTNHGDSDLAQISHHTLELHAGPELSVAATKTFVNSAVCGVWLIAELVGDDALLDAIRDLPARLEDAVTLDWTAIAEVLEARNSLFCLGRGPSYAISNEAALKFKETCQLHAESYSSAEVLHGPVSIVDSGFPVIALTAADKAEAALVRVADELAGKGAKVFATSDKAQVAHALPVARTGHPLTDPLTLIASFYAMVEQVAVKRGIDPDHPRHLKKVTETV